MGLGDFLGSTISGVDQEWFAKLRHVHRLIETLQSRGVKIKYQYNNKMQLLISRSVCPNCDWSHALFDYLEIDEAIRILTKAYHGADLLDLYDDWLPYEYFGPV